MKNVLTLMVVASPATNSFAADPSGDSRLVESIPGIVAFWTFGEASGKPRLSTGTKNEHALLEVEGPINTVEGGPYSGSAAEFNGKQYFRIPHEELRDLNIAGKDAQVSMFAVVMIHDLDKSRTIAGIWNEGKGKNDDTGTRQYALLMNMSAYGGPKKLTPHISSEGGVTYRADGSKFPWCADYAATRRSVPTDIWCTLGFTYDGKYIRAYINGVLDEWEVDPKKHRREDRYFTKEGPAGKNRGINPYYHGRGIFQYDRKLHVKSKIAPSDFTVGARTVSGKLLGGLATEGRFGALAVWSRALSDAEMKLLHDSAGVDSLNQDADRR